MSHIVEEKTAISHPDVNLLRQAAQIVADQIGGTVEAHYLDWYWKQKTDCLLAIHAPQLRRGIGLKIDEAGTLGFIGDSWGAKQVYEQVQQQILQTYVALGYMQALQAVGYTAQALEGEQAGQVIIQGVQYA